MGPGYFNPDLVWQQYNPYPNMEMNVDEMWVFIDQDAPGVENESALSPDSPITSGLREVLGLYTGSVRSRGDATLKHTPLLRTGALSGLIGEEKVRQILMGQSSLMREITGVSPVQTIAMTIEGELPKTLGDDQAELDKDEEADDEDETSEDGSGDEKSEASESGTKPDRGIKVVYVADTDLMLPVFLQIRASLIRQPTCDSNSRTSRSC